MSIRSLFTRRRATAATAHGTAACALGPRESLAQLAMTGCLSTTWYADADTQTDALLAACGAVDPNFVARTALYAREHGFMKDTPVLLLAYLSVHAPQVAEPLFARLISNAGHLRSYVQVLRSGRLGKRSLGSRAKRWVQTWLEQASDELLVAGLVGNAPSLADVIRMAHPRAASIERSAFYAHAIGKPTRDHLLPEGLQALARFRADATQAVPAVPFQMLTDLPLTTAHWCAIAARASWSMTRMNLNTFARHGVFKVDGMTERLARRLVDPSLIRKARAFPYQLFAAYQAAQGVPREIREALRKASEIAAGSLPRMADSLAIAIDVSGSMESPISGIHRGASSVMRCVDVAGVIAASLLKRHPQARVLPFAEAVRPWAPPREPGVLETAAALTRLLGGGTAISAPLQRLVQMDEAPDLTILISDNQSWAEAQWGNGGTAATNAWMKLRRRNPKAKLVCLDLQPYAHTQVADREGVLNIGGFSDAVFPVIQRFAEHGRGGGHWAREIDRIRLPDAVAKVL